MQAVYISDSFIHYFVMCDPKLAIWRPEHTLPWWLEHPLPWRHDTRPDDPRHWRPGHEEDWTGQKHLDGHEAQSGDAQILAVKYDLFKYTHLAHWCVDYCVCFIYFMSCKV